MKQKKKRKYVKPKITKITFDAKTAVLATCKFPSSSGGPMNSNCRGPGNKGQCMQHGS